MLLPEIRRDLAQGNYSEHTLDALASIGAGCQSLLPGLLSILQKEQNAIVKAKIIDTIGQMGPCAQPAIPIIQSMMLDRSSRSYVAGVVAQGLILNSQEQAARTLCTELMEPRCHNRGLIMCARIAMRASDPFFMGDMSFLSEDQKRIRLYELAAMLNLAVPDAPMFEFLTKELQWCPWRVEALPELGKEGVAYLFKLLKGEDAGLRFYAAFALMESRLSTPEVVAALITGLEDSEPWVRETCAHALGRMGPNARGASKRLFELLGDESWSVRIGAIHALVSMGEDPKHPTAIFCTGLGKGSWDGKAIDIGQDLLVIQTAYPEILYATCSSALDSTTKNRRAYVEAVGEILRTLRVVNRQPNPSIGGGDSKAPITYTKVWAFPLPEWKWIDSMILPKLKLLGEDGDPEVRDCARRVLKEQNAPGAIERSGTGGEPRK